MKVYFLWVVSYDISDDRRRDRVAKLMLSYGERVQYSVFECRLKDADVKELAAGLAGLISPGGDSIRMYRLCSQCQEKMVLKGQAPDLALESDFLII